MVALILTAACTAPLSRPGVSDARRIERSAKKKPAWITQIPEDPRYFFATGIATGATSLEDGKSQALAAAIEEVVNYLGIRAEVSYKESRTELTTRLVSRITSEGQGRLAQGRLLEMYYERSRSARAAGAQDSFDVFVLLRIPWQIVNEEEQRLRDDRQARLDLAASLVEKGSQLAEAGEAGPALRRWLQAARLLEGQWAVDGLNQRLQAEVADLSTSIELQTAEADDQQPETDRREVRAVLRWKGKSIPLAGLPLRVHYGTGGPPRTEPATTDGDGVARISLPPGWKGAAPPPARVSVDRARLLSVGDGRSDLPQGFRTALGPLERLSVSLPGAGASPVAALSSASLPSPTFFDQPSAPATLLEAPALAPPVAAREPGGALELSVESAVSQLSREVIDQGGDVGFLVDLRAPSRELPRRRPLNLALVLDRSGSMADEGKLEYVKQAVRLVTANLSPVDHLTVVSYSNEAQVLVENGSIHDRLLIDHHLEMMDAMGTTNLSAGLFEAADVLGRHFEDNGINRLVLLSDGLANQGVINSEALARFAAQSSARGITVSTVGLGQRFDEDMLLAIATGGQGNYYYVSDPDELPQVFLQELQELSTVVAQNVSLVLEPARGVEIADTFGMPATPEGDGLRFKLGNLAAGARSLVGFALRPLPDRRQTHLGTIRLRYDDVSDQVQRIETSVPLEVSYSPGPAARASAAPTRVEQYLDILAAMDVMLLAEKSGDRTSIEDTIDFLEARLDALGRWAGSADDPEITSLAEVFEHCVMELRHRLDHGGPHHETLSGDLRKEVQYKLYRLRRRAGSWSAPADEGSASVTPKSHRRPRHYPRRSPEH